MVQGVGFEPTYDFRRPGLQPGAINHSTTLAFILPSALPDFSSQQQISHNIEDLNKLQVLAVALIGAFNFAGTLCARVKPVVTFS